MGGRRSRARRRRRRRTAGSGGTPDNSISGEQQKVPISQKEESPAPEPRRSPEDRRALRRRLLSLIRGYYLDAFSRLPTANLRTSLARGLLVAGHCYGPLHPVHNIIANSIWYDAAFPLRHSDRIEVDVLSAQGTDRAVRRSLDGLLACLRHLCPFLSADDALWHLSRSRADLRVAVSSARCPSLRRAAPSLLRAAEPEEVKAAFQVAAQAARHPNPAALALFASSVLPGIERDVVRLMVSKRALSSLDIDRLSNLVLPSPLPSELSSCQTPPDPSPKINQIIADKRRGVAKWYDFLLGIADAALRKFARQTGLQYELHTIYGESLLVDEDYHRYFHINFMAQPKEDPSSGSGLQPGQRLYFFAEAFRPPRQDFHEEDISLCCLVEPSPGDIDNCLACLTNEHKINHPAVQTAPHPPLLRFGGQCYEIDKTGRNWEFRPDLGVDYLFFDPDRDNYLVQYLHNHFARIDAYFSNLSDDEDDDGPPPGSYCRQLV